MFIQARFHYFLFSILLCAAAASPQQNTSPSSSPTELGNRKITLDVVVTPKSGPPVTDLQQQDFTILDNKAPQTITSFQAITGRDARLEVILVIDAVNIGAVQVANQRIQIDKFLHADGGRLAYPIALAVFTDDGIRILGNFSSDGNALSAALDRDDLSIRAIGRSGGYYGAGERLELSLKALHQLVASEAPRPLRKVMLWVSPGWPLLSGIGTSLDSKQERQIFASIVRFSTELMQARVTLYSIDPLGSAEGVDRVYYYKNFLKGVSKPSDVYPGDLGLQVLAVQSGGLALSPTNDIAGLLQECLADSAPYYEISFNSLPAKQPDEYHHLEIKIAKPALTARTRQGYYAQPLPPG
jgi:VWFA-related protein